MHRQIIMREKQWENEIKNYIGAFYVIYEKREDNRQCFNDDDDESRVKSSQLRFESVHGINNYLLCTGYRCDDDNRR